LVGDIGGCLGIEPIRAGGDSVIRPRETIEQIVAPVDPEVPTETISQSVTVSVT